MKNKWQFWVDRGGTFTDVVAKAPDGSLHTKKLLSDNPEAYEDAALQGIREFLVLEKNDAQALTLVGEPDWKAIGYELLSNPAVPQSTIDDLLALAQTCRRIRQQMDDDGGLALWKTDG